jgi:hypothetical protein
MAAENELTLRRFHEAMFVHGAVNATGVAFSIHEYGKHMLAAGWGTDQINADPAIRIMVMYLSILCGFEVSGADLLKAHREFGDLRSLLQGNGHEFV